MNIRQIAYEYTSRAGADDIWERVIVQMEAALRDLLAQAIGACEARAKENSDASFLQRRLEDVEIVKLLQDFDREAGERRDRHEIRFKDRSRHNWLIVLWRSGETTNGDHTWAYTVDRERAGDMVEVYQGEITGQGDQLPNPRDIILDYFMYVAGAMFTGVEHWQIMYPDGRKESA